MRKFQLRTYRLRTEQVAAVYRVPRNALLLLGAHRQLLILCAREFQNSLADSVHRLLADQIEQGFYRVGKTSVRGGKTTPTRSIRSRRAGRTSSRLASPVPAIVE